MGESSGGIPRGCRLPGGGPLWACGAVDGELAAHDPDVFQM
ncbi:MAG: hypothetical protein ACRDU5_19695 [Mycobacterium sp.]